MKKVSLLILVSMILLLAFVSCDKLPPLFGEEPEPEHGHDWMEATCEAPKTCACGATEGEKLPHTWAEATCSSPKVCTFCNATEGNALNHVWSKPDCDTPATCSLCGTTSGDALGHSWVSASCVSAKHCSTCYIEEGEALGHDWAEATCLTPKTCNVCKETEGEALGHTEVDVPGYAATCTENGLTDGKFCTVCEKTTLAQQLIPATGHTASDWIRDLDPTCTELGSEHKECTVCQTLLDTKSVSALGHTESDWIIDVESTCDTKGSKHKVCTVCGVTTKTALIPVEGHVEGAPEVVERVEATCDEAGYYVEVVKCATCGTELARNTVEIKALGHKMSDATCQAPKTCSVCGKTEGEVLPCKAGEPKKENDVAPTCEDDGSYDLATYCVWCNTELSRQTFTVGATGHDMAPATCDAPATCKNGCGHTEGAPLKNHTVVAHYESGLLYYTCATCEESYYTDVALVYDGTKLPMLTMNGDPTITVNANGEYDVVAGTQRSQYMLYFPSNSKGHADMFKDFTGAKNSLGVLSFKFKAGNVTEAIRFIVMTARDNPNWDASGGWNGCSMDLLNVKPNGDGTYAVTGNNITGATFANVTGDEWVDVKMFMHLSPDGMFKISYYINGNFCNVYERDLLNTPSDVQTIKDLMIQSAYICGYTAPGTGWAFDDLYFGYANDCEWAFDEHEHVWADATCTAPKTCTACGLTDGEALGHATVPHDAKAPTCTEIGWDAYETCSRCDYTTYVELPATGHNYGSATCDQAAACTVCGFSTGEALGHEFKADAYVYNNDAKCGVDGTKTAKCSRCDATDTLPAEGTALEHNWAGANCATASTCTLCGITQGEPNKAMHDKLTCTNANGVTTYACATCGYSFKVDTGDYMDGTHYNGMGVNAPDNGKYYTSSSEKTNYPVLKDGYYEYVRNDVEAGAQKQLQVWLPSPNGGTNKFSGFSAATNSIGYLSFSINAYTDHNLEMKLVDNRVDNVDLNGDGTAESIRWGDAWAINDPVFRVLPPSDGKAQLVGFNSTVLATVDVDENNYTGWVDVAIQIVLDPVTDQVIATYYVNGAYVATSARALSTHTDAIQSVYINSNNKAPGTGYKIDNLAFGYTAHKHNLTSSVANGVLTYTCECGASYKIDEFHKWNGSEGDSTIKNVPNGNIPMNVNGQGQYEFIFKPATDVAPDFSASGTQSQDGWYEYDGKGYAGGQIQMWMPSNNRGEGTFEGFSCENNAVGVISFKMKSNVARHPDWDTSITFSVGKPRNAANWNDGGSWADDSINIFTIEEYQTSGVVLKGGLNGTNINFGAIPVTADGWSEWFDVMMVIEMTDDGYLTIYYYVNNEFVGSDARDLNNPGGYRTLNPKEIEALQISGWTYAPNTGIMFDDFYFGFTKEGHNTLDGHVHNVTEATNCGEKSVCSCGWTGYTIAHSFTEATCTAPATCTGCGATEGVALPHTLTPNGAILTCTTCKGYYNVDNSVQFDGDEDFYYSKNGNMPLVKNDGVYEAIFNTEQAMPDISEVPVDGNGKPVAGSVVGEWAWNNNFGAQHMFWLPNNTSGSGLSGFSCANNSVGVLSFKMQTNVTNNFNISLAKARGDKDWSGWGTSELKVLNVGAYSENGIVLKGGIGAGTNLVTIPVEDGWSAWFQVDIMIQLKSDNTIALDYYINGEFVKSFSGAMTIDSYDVRCVYINGWTYATNTGIKLDDFVFGCATGEIVEYEEPFYNEEIDAANVQSETLKTIVAAKIKQCDQAKPSGKEDDLFAEGGTPVYVLADKNGETVEALYFSRTVAWTGKETKQLFTEFRFDVDGTKKATAISFDYKIKGTVEKNDRFTFTDLDGNKFSADAYVQIKTPANHPLAGDNYPELQGTDLILDGEWHTMSYTFAEPLEIINILVNLYKFQGELLISNLNVEFEQPVEEPFYNEVIDAANVQSETLKTIVAGKIKQCDQSNPGSDPSKDLFAEGGTPVYVLADKNGETVEALYISRSVAWLGTEAAHFTEFRFAINGEKEGPAVTSISFDYKIEGTVAKNERYVFTDFDGTKFYSDAYVQVKTISKDAAVIEQAGDNYPELAGTDLVLDGEWHTFTYNFATPRYLIDFLLNLYQFQGELLIANINVEFVKECQHTNTTTNKEDATCTTAGYEKVTCDDCGATVSEKTFPATNHANKTTTSVDATCTTAGSNKVVCDDCGATLVDETVAALGHKLVPQYANGVLTYACSVCKNSCALDEFYYFDGNNSFTNASADLNAFAANKVNGYYDMTAIQVPTNNQSQIWVPTNNSAASEFLGFTCANNALGFFSFDIKPLNNSGAIEIILAERRNDGNNWSGWDKSSLNVLKIDTIKDNTVTLMGDPKYGTYTHKIATVSLDENEGWINVLIKIELTEDGNVTMTYYVNGANCGTYTEAMTVTPGIIRSAYIKCVAPNVGEGYYIDNIALGYNAKAHNTLEGEHNTVSEATCQAGAVCSCGWTGTPISHKLTYKTEGEGIEVSCAYGCGEGYTLDKVLYTDGTTSSGVLTPLAGNYSGGYTTHTSGAPVVSEEGYLVFARAEGLTDKGQFQLHAPHAAWQDCDRVFPDFSTEKSAVGVLDFNINLNLDTTGNLRFIITERVETGFAWGKNDITLLTFSQASADGKITLNGWGINNLATFQKGEDGYTGWINIKVTIELSKNAKDENIGLVKFYVNGEHVGTTHSHLTTLLGGRINNLYITGNSTDAGTGFMLDDFVFGYTAHEHVYAEKETKPTCTDKGYTTYTCDCGDTYTGNEVDALGHAFGEATCTAPSTCATCGATEGEALGHADENGDYKCDRCSTKMLPSDGTALTITQAIAVAKVGGSSYTTQKYYITGIVTNVYNTTYGNLYLKDADGNQICIYGLYSFDGSIRYDKMEYKPVEGDELTVYTVLGTYNSTPQGKNAWMDEVVAHEHNYNTEVTAPTCVASGFTTYTCTICSGSYQAEETEALGHTTEAGTCERCGLEIGGAEPVIGVLAAFDLGADGTASHNDGSEIAAGKTYTASGYTLKMDSVTKVYGGARDAKGNSCLKLGTSKVTGSLTFTVPEDVTEVVIYVAKYKSNTTKINVNGTAYTLTKNSNDGVYDVITIDTSVTKTVTFATVSGGVRCMINTIEFKGVVA